jgi:hypothetical protein
MQLVPDLVEADELDHNSVFAEGLNIGLLIVLACVFSAA